MQSLWNRIKDHSALIQALLFVFVVGSWPFFRFPLTDGDIAHWLGIAKEIRIHFNFLSSSQDQAHGPFLFWTSGILTQIRPNSMYFYNLSNLLCGVLGIGWIYYYALRNWKDRRIASLSVVLAATSIVWLYLSRTPMYDWPAAIFFFGFCVHYLRYIKTGIRRHFLLALGCVAVAGLSRFSISIGLSGLFIFFANISLRRSPIKMILEGIAMVAVTGLVTAPWAIVQSHIHGHAFIDTFCYDNFGRYIKEPGNAPVYHDYYGFALYVVVGLIPHSFLLLASVFQKSIFNRIKMDREQWIILSGWLPCLLIFSFSGHVKLGRYIAYVFPMLFLFLGYNLVKYDLLNPAFLRRASRMTAVVAVIMAVLLAIVAKNNPDAVRQSPLFVAAVIGLVMGLLITSWITISKKSGVLLNSPTSVLPVYAVIYIAFFSALAYEYPRAEFLKPVRVDIQRSLSSD
jgi:hypothetical protein